MCLNNSKMAAHMPVSRASLSHFLLLNFLDIGDSCLCAFWPLPMKIRLGSNRNATGWTPIEVYSDFSEFHRVAIKEAPSSLLKWICSPFFPEDCWNRFSESRNDNILINESCCDCKNAYWNGVALRYLRLHVVSVFIWKRKFLQSTRIRWKRSLKTDLSEKSSPEWNFLKTLFPHARVIAQERNFSKTLTSH